MKIKEDMDIEELHQNYITEDLLSTIKQSEDL